MHQSGARQLGGTLTGPCGQTCGFAPVEPVCQRQWIVADDGLQQKIAHERNVARAIHGLHVKRKVEDRFDKSYNGLLRRRNSAHVADVYCRAMQMGGPRREQAVSDPLSSLEHHDLRPAACSRPWRGVRAGYVIPKQAPSE